MNDTPSPASEGSDENVASVPVSSAESVAESFAGPVSEPRADSAAETRVAALEAQVFQLNHDLLTARDTIAGLTAEWTTMRERADEIAATEVGVAYARVDDLENRLDAMLHELRWNAIQSGKAIAELRATPTWRLGTLIARPLAVVARRRR